jgi:P4 family phage/plasmid primase-like protien
MVVTMGAIDELKWLADQGIRFALPIGRSKNKFELDWPNKPHTLSDAIAHTNTGGNVGILTGKHSGGIIAVDRDVNFPQTLKILGQFSQTAKIIRDNAPERGKFLYRVKGEIPATVSWKPAGAKYPECEFLGDNGQRHALCPPSEIDDGHYRLIDTKYGIQEITPVELDYIWRLITGGSIDKDTRAREDAEADRHAKDAYVHSVKEAWTVLKVFEYFDKTKNGTVKEKGQTRLLGNGGLLISADGTQWFCHSDSIGGDMLDALCFCRWQKKLDRNNPKMFWDAIDFLAEAAHIAKPQLHADGTKSAGNSNQSQAETPSVNTGDFLLREGAHDEGNAQCVHKRYEGKFLNSESLGWLAYTGTHWKRAEAETAVERAITETLIARVNAALLAGPDQHDTLIKRCIPQSARVQAAKSQLRSLVSILPECFDNEPDLLNCRNGVVNLRTGEITPHHPAQRFMHCTTVDYDPDANYEPWANWLIDAAGADMENWLQMAVGYSLTGHTREEVMFYLYGPPRSGKGTFTETILDMLGPPLADVVGFHTLTAPSDADTQNFNLAPLHNARFIAASESNAYERFNEAKVKLVTGGDKIQCSFKHQTPFSYRPKYKIWLSSNQPVNADPDDDAVWGRLQVVEFPHSHLGSEDKELKQTMRSTETLKGVLAWAIMGAIRWYQLGGAGLPELATSAATKQQQREALDNVQGWLGECCTTGGEGFCSNSLLYLSYERWCKENGIEPKKQKGFSQALIRKGFDNKPKKVGLKVERGFHGIGFS